MVSRAPSRYLRVGLPGMVVAVGGGRERGDGGYALEECSRWGSGEGRGVCAAGGVEGGECGVVLEGNETSEGGGWCWKEDGDDRGGRIG